MTMYLVKFSYTSETWARFVANPEDRREALAPLFEATGGKLHGLWYAFGDADGYVLAELPDASAALGTLVRVAASGAGSVSTTVLITVEEMLDALRSDTGSGYRPPGARPAAG
jgi:uncharacterized protein with GYD domain